MEEAILVTGVWLLVSLFVSSLNNLSPDALVGENFEQNPMRDLSVNDVSFLDPAIERADACLDFWNHPACQNF